MELSEKVKKGLENCTRLGGCVSCPYFVDNTMAQCTPVMAAETLAYIRQLEAQVPKWISVKERLPERNTAVIVAVDDGHVFQTLYAYDGWDLWEGCTCNVTHWMPLPEPPKEEV